MLKLVKDDYLKTRDNATWVHSAYKSVTRKLYHLRTSLLKRAVMLIKCVPIQIQNGDFPEEENPFLKELSLMVWKYTVSKLTTFIKGQQFSLYTCLSV